MEEIGPTNPVAAIASFMTPARAPTLEKTIPLAPIHSFTKQIVPSMYEESLI